MSCLRLSNPDLYPSPTYTKALLSVSRRLCAGMYSGLTTRYGDVIDREAADPESLESFACIGQIILCGRVRDWNIEEWLRAKFEGCIISTDVWVAFQHGWSLDRLLKEKWAGRNALKRGWVGLPTIEASAAPGAGWDGTRTSGFSGATSEGPTGDSEDTYYGMACVARWVTLPFKHVGASDIVAIGVIAQHSNGIDKVGFIANGGTQLDVTSRTFVADYGWAYWADISGDEWFAQTNGLGELRAVAYPKVGGETKCLQGTTWSSQSSYPFSVGTFSTVNKTMYVSPTGDDTTGTGAIGAPFKSPNKAAHAIHTLTGTADGAVIYCLAGADYDYCLEYGPGNAWANATANNRPITLTRAPGLATSDVVFTHVTQTAGNFWHLLNLVGVTVAPNTEDRSTIRSSGASGYLITDDCELLGVNTEYFGSFAGDWAATFNHNANVHDNLSGLGGEMCSNCVLDTLGEDAHHDTRCIWNNIVTNLIQADAVDAHADGLQCIAGDNDNLIVENYHVVKGFNAQGRFIARDDRVLTNSAYVNYQCGQDTGGGSSKTGDTDFTGILYAHNTMLQGDSYLHQTGALSIYTMHRIVNCVYVSMGAGGDLEAPNLDDAGFSWENCHFGTGRPASHVDCTTGGTVTDWYVNPGTGDYTPKVGSVLLSTGTGRAASPWGEVGFDLDNVLIGAEVDIGSIQSEDETPGGGGAIPILKAALQATGALE